MIIITKDFVKFFVIIIMIEYLYATRLMGRNQFQIKRYQSVFRIFQVYCVFQVCFVFLSVLPFSFVKTLRSSSHLFCTLIYV